MERAHGAARVQERVDGGGDGGVVPARRRLCALGHGVDQVEPAVGALDKHPAREARVLRAQAQLRLPEDRAQALFLRVREPDEEVGRTSVSKE